AEHEASTMTILPDVDKLVRLSVDNPAQSENIKQLRAPVKARLEEFARAIDFVKRNDIAGGIAMLREVGTSESVQRINDLAGAVLAEENAWFAARTATADRTQRLASAVTVAGSGLVIALAGISIFLVRRSARARDEAEARLRDNNLNLETTVDERTADLREA